MNITKNKILHPTTLGNTRNRLITLNVKDGPLMQVPVDKMCTAYDTSHLYAFFPLPNIGMHPKHGSSWSSPGDA